MSYYNIRPSNRVSGTGILTPDGQNPEPMNPLQRTEGGFRTRDVAGNETVQSQLDALLRGDSNYITRARNSASATAAGRGLLNSSMAAGAGEAAAIDAALPIAQQDASWYGQTHADNMDAENQYLLAQGGWNNAFDLASMSTSAQRAIAEMNAEEERRQFNEGTRRYDQQFGEDQRRYDEDWRREQEATQTANDAARRNYTYSSLMNTFLSDPSYWRDGPGATGAMTYYLDNFENIWNQLYGGGP